jgi:conjugal transfer pilus assembly protein TraV
MAEGSRIMTDLLNSHEMASLNRALARRTDARVRVGPEPISVTQGIALWNAAAMFGEAPVAGSLASAPRRRRKARPAIVRDSSGFRRMLGAGAALVATASLGACTSLGGNVQGNFSCRAPGGICAPTSTIDDAALALIGADQGVVPAGPYSAPTMGALRMIQAGANEPVRSGEKVLRIVFPSHIDRAGRFRETTAIHAVVERAVWTTAPAAPARRISAVTLEGSSRQVAESGMRSLGELASTAPEVRFPDPVASVGAESAVGADTAVLTDQAALAPTARPARVSRVSPGMSGTAAAAPPVSAGVNSSSGTSAMAALNYSLPSQAADGPPNPIESIRAQVAQRLRAPITTDAVPSVAGPPVAGSIVSRPTGAPAAQSSQPGAPSGEAAKADAANRPSLFPVSGVNP